VGWELPWPEALLLSLAKAKKDDVENNFMTVPSCLSSNIAVFKRLRAV
jgi:hypothetical protein